MPKIACLLRPLPAAAGLAAMLYIAGMVSGMWPANQAQRNLIEQVRDSEIANPRTKAALFALDSSGYISRNDYERVMCNAMESRCF